MIPTIRPIRALFLIFLTLLTGSIITTAQSPISKAEQFYLQAKFDSSLKYLKSASDNYRKSGADSMYFVSRCRMAKVLMAGNYSDSTGKILSDNSARIIKKYGRQNELLAICYDLYGDWLMSVSDVESAMNYYRASLNIRLALYPVKNNNLAYSYANIARYHNFKIAVDSAYYYSAKALQMFDNSTSFNWDFAMERILTEHAYAYKIKHLNANINKPKCLVETRRFYFDAVEYVSRTYGKDTWPLIGIYRNIGNTFTDQVLFTKKHSDRVILFQMGMNYYDKALTLINTSTKNSKELSTMYYVKGLLNDYCYSHDSIFQTVRLLDLAMKSLVNNYTGNNTFSQNDLSDCDYKYNLMILISYKTLLYYNNYHVTHIKDRLTEAYKLLQNSIPLWNQIILEFESPYTTRLITIYNLKIFNYLIDIAWTLYTLENDNKYLYDIFNYSEQSKISLQQRLLLDAGVQNLTTFKNQSIHPTMVQNKLTDKNMLYINFFDTTFVTAVSCDTFIVRKIVNKIPTDSLLKNYRSAMMNNNVADYQAAANAIYKTYLEPILEVSKIGSGELIIAADGILSQVSVSGLVTNITASHDDFRYLDYLCKNYKVRYVLSASNLTNGKKIKVPQKRSMIAFVPDFSKNASLPFSKKLVNDLEDRISCTAYYGHTATVKSFYNEASDYSYIHIATHAEGSKDDNSKTRLLFTDYENINAFISIDSIFRMRFSSDLAVLSACETNVGRHEYGEGTMNFSRAFIYAGVKNTVTTQWKVDDRVTSSILEAFYENLLDGKSMSTSLNESQIQYLSKCKSSSEANPINWSGINLTGADGTVDYNKRFKYKYPVSITAFVMILFIGLIIKKRKRHPDKEIPVLRTKK